MKNAIFLFTFLNLIQTMKKMFLMAGICLLTASCSNENDVVSNPVETAPVRVEVNDFSMSVEDFAGSGGRTRATVDPSTYNDVKAITLAFYNGSTEVYKATHVKNDGNNSSFGSFSCHLPLGNYTMVVVGYGLLTGDVFTLTSPTEASFSPKARETFVKTQTVNISSTNAVTLSATLERIISGLQIISTDTRVEGVAKIRTTYAKGGLSFSPMTGLATANTGFTVDVSPSKPVGQPVNLASFVFLASDVQDINITIDVLDNSDKVLFTKTIPNVPFKRNRKTILRGPVFQTTAQTTSAFLIESAWLDETTVEF